MLMQQKATSIDAATVSCRTAKQNQQTRASASQRSQAQLFASKLHSTAASANLSSTKQLVMDRPSRPSTRPVTALLSNQELAQLISKSGSRYADNLLAPSVEPSTDVLQGMLCCAGSFSWHSFRKCRATQGYMCKAAHVRMQGSSNCLWSFECPVVYAADMRYVMCCKCCLRFLYSLAFVTCTCMCMEQVLCLKDSDFVVCCLTVQF